MTRETWKTCLGGVYEASSLGRVRRAVRCNVLSQSRVSGYPRVSVCLGGIELSRMVHALVAEAFLGPRPPGAYVNHIDGVKTNNTPINLEYCTPRENSEHAARMGLVASGSRHGRYTKPHRTARGTRVNTARLSERDVIRMRALRGSGATLTALMKEFGLSKSATHQVVTRKSWRHVG